MYNFKIFTIMKKILLLFVALLTSTIAFAQTEIDGIYYNLDNENQTAEVTYYEGILYSGDITIPEKVTYNTIEYNITSIGEKAFMYCSSLTSITIPNSVTSIEIWAFLGCSSLTSITIPNNVTDIGQYAFQGCNALTSITIPNNVTSIRYDTFKECSALTSINVDINNPYYTSIDGVLYNKNVTNLICCPGGKTSITIPNSVTYIGNAAFQGCNVLISINVDTNHPNYASIDGVLYNKDVTTLICCPGSKTSITIPNSVTSIKSYAFYECSSLTSITIPNSVTSIENYAFWWCERLTSITIPNSVTSIEYGAFQGCRALTSITIPNSITSIENSTFMGCRALTSITIPNSVTSIGHGAFEGCRALTSITIPNSVTSIGIAAFQECALTSITIPNSVTSIGDQAFYQCSSLTSITIPNNVTYIGESAFTYCYSLTSITIGNSVTSIGNQASVKQGAFFGCTSLTTITCLSSTPPEASNLEAKYETCTLLVPKGSLNDYQNHAEWGKFSNIQELEGEKYTITTAVNDESMGSVTGEGEYEKDSEITLTATANSGYRFAQWSDGNTDNPRIVTVTENKTYTAEFELNTYTLIAHSYSPNMGGVKITLTAEPIKGFEFVGWSDGSTENPYEFYITENTELYAYFQIAQGGNPVDFETSKISSANIYTTNGTLHVENATENYHILDAAGRLIYSGNATTLTLPRGIYLITMGAEVEKIIL